MKTVPSGPRGSLANECSSFRDAEAKHGPCYMVITNVTSDGSMAQYNISRQSDGQIIATCSSCFESTDMDLYNDKPKQKVSLDSVIMPEDKKQQIRAAISQLEHHNLIFEKWGFGEVFEKGTAVSLLFYGVPGTGKTLAAQAIADSLGLRLKMIQTAEVESSEPGQAERNIKAFFSNAVHQKQLLLFDECDSLICDRNEVGMILGGQINALLTALESYTGVVVFTTNRLGKMDPAFERRVSAKIEFTFPDKSQRRAIWQRLLPKKAPVDVGVDLDVLAGFPLAGGNIKNAVLNAARHAAFHRKTTIDEECFHHAIEKEAQSIKGFEAAFEQQTKLPRPASGEADVSRKPGRLAKKAVRTSDSPTQS
jgi:AAA+ superfamily predicted ATPase